MKHEVPERTPAEDGLSSHLEQALDCADEQTKHYHIRQALQLHIAESDDE
jgi:hypothetical protein